VGSYNSIKAVSYVTDSHVKYLCHCKGKTTSERIYWSADRKKFVTRDGKRPLFLHPIFELSNLSHMIEGGLKELLHDKEEDLNTLKRNLTKDGCVLRMVKKFAVLGGKKGLENVSLVCSNAFGIYNINRYDWIKTIEGTKKWRTRFILYCTALFFFEDSVF
jgi:hypothetical protein